MLKCCIIAKLAKQVDKDIIYKDWILDLEITHYFYYNKTQFLSLRVIEKEIKIANDKIVRLAGYKTVKLTAYTDKDK